MSSIFAASSSLKEDFSFFLENGKAFVAVHRASEKEQKIFPLVFAEHLDPKSLKSRVKMHLQRGDLLRIQGLEISFVARESQNLLADEALNKAVEAYSKAREELRLKIILDQDHQADHVCPITGTLFEAPVVDPCGHTFEKWAIEEEIVRSESCPLSRAPLRIEELKPNRNLQSIVAGIRASSPIVLLGCMSGKKIIEDSHKASKNLALAQQMLDSGEIEAALNFFAKAFESTNDLQKYAQIPSIYENAESKEKAALAYLYFYSENKNLLQGANLAFKLVPELESLQVCYARACKHASLVDLDAHVHHTTEAFSHFKNLALRKSDKAAALREQKQLTEAVDPKTSYVPGLHAAPLPNKDHEEAEGLLNEAFTYFSEALSCHPHDLELYQLIEKYADEATKGRLYLTGFLAFFRHNRPQALSFYEKACALLPSRPHARLAHLALLDKGAKEKRAIQRELALLFKAQGKLEQALPYYQKAACSGTIKDLENYFDALLEGSQRDKAESVLTDWLNREGEAHEPLIQKGLQLFGRKIPFLARLLQNYLQPNQSEKAIPLILELGALYEIGQDFAAAQKTYRIGYDIFHNFDASFKLAALLARTNAEESQRMYIALSKQCYLKGDLKGMTDCLAKIALDTLAPQDDQALFNLRTQFYITSLHQELAKTKEELQRSIVSLQGLQSAHQQADAEMQKAFELYRRGDLKQTKEQVEKALRQNPDHIFALGIHGELFALEKNYEAACKDFDHILRLDPLQSKALLWRGCIRFSNGQHLEALKDLDKSFEKDPSQAIPEQFLFALHALPENCDALIASLNFGEGDKTRLFSLVVRAMAYKQQKASHPEISPKREAALKDLNRCLELNPRWSFALTELADLFRIDGEFPRAKEYCDQALAQNPREIFALVCRGNLFRLLEAFPKAVEDWTKALEINPHCLVARYYRGALCAALFAKQNEFEQNVSKELEMHRNYLERCSPSATGPLFDYEAEKMKRIKASGLEELTQSIKAILTLTSSPSLQKLYQSDLDHILKQNPGHPVAFIFRYFTPYEMRKDAYRREEHYLLSGGGLTASSEEITKFQNALARFSPREGLEKTCAAIFEITQGGLFYKGEQFSFSEYYEHSLTVKEGMRYLNLKDYSQTRRRLTSDARDDTRISHGNDLFKTVIMGILRHAHVQELLVEMMLI